MPSSAAGQLELSGQEKGPIVDCDVHVQPSDETELRSYLPEQFQRKGIFYPSGNWSSPIGDSRDGTGPRDGPSGSDPDVVREQHLDAIDIDHAIITGGRLNLRASTLPETRYAAALMRAYNEWLLDTWLTTDERLYGSISVSSNAPEAAAEEIHRLGDHPDMVQVVMGGATQTPLGQEPYWPIYEAAAEEDLPVTIHAGAEGYGIANPNTGPGYPSTYLEMRSVAPANYMGQLLSLIYEGVFVEFSDLQVVMAGSGFGWVPSFIWRLEKVWKGLTHEMPWVEQPPIEYVRKHVRFTSHPLNEPGDDEELDQLLEMIYAEDTLMFSSNYPDWDSYAPGDPLPDLSPSLEHAIFSENAVDLYGF